MQDPLDRPSPGRIVLFRSRTGKYDCPAIVTATQSSLNPDGVALWEESGGQKGVPPITGNMQVHLTVFTPGLPGQRGSAEDFAVTSEHPVQENTGGSYQEWDVALADPEQPPSPGSWRWPMAAYPAESVVDDPGLEQARQTQPESD